MTAKPEPKSTTGLPRWLSVDAALAHVLDVPYPHEMERVSLAEAHLRVLAEDCLADLDQPAFERAMMDGLALRSGDCVEEGVWLRELGQAPAGTPFEGGVTPGSCVRVMTGGVVPSGADAVVPVELVTAERLGQQDGYRIRASARPGQHVASRGSEVREGERVLAAGERLTAARVGVLASFGCSEPSVFHRPRVSVVPTGTEIVSIDDRPGLGQVRNSNAWALRAHFGSLGGEVELVDAVIDDQDVLDRALASAAERSELIVTCGGVSMGDYDLVVGSLRRLGAEIQFHRVALKPGKPVLLARLGSAWVLGLPGNPVSAMTCATLFGRPLMARLSGERGARWRVTRAKLAGAIKGTRSRVEFRPGRWTRDGAVTPVKTAGSADLAHFAAGDAWLMLPPKMPAREPGDEVDVWEWTSP